MSNGPRASYSPTIPGWLARLARRLLEARLHHEIAHLDDRLLEDVGLKRTGSRIVRRQPRPNGRERG